LEQIQAQDTGKMPVLPPAVFRHLPHATLRQAQGWLYDLLHFHTHHFTVFYLDHPAAVPEPSDG